LRSPALHRHQAVANRGYAEFRPKAVLAQSIHGARLNLHDALGNAAGGDGQYQSEYTYASHALKVGRVVHSLYART
jgi:hypothetical protein